MVVKEKQIHVMDIVSIFLLSALLGQLLTGCTLSRGWSAGVYVHPVNATRDVKVLSNGVNQDGSFETEANRR